MKATATDAEIKRAFRKQALECHPDKHKKSATAEEKEALALRFQQLTAVLEVLTSKVKRRRYDRYGRKTVHSDEGGRRAPFDFEDNPDDNFQEFFDNFFEHWEKQWNEAAQRGIMEAHDIWVNWLLMIATSSFIIVPICIVVSRHCSKQRRTAPPSLLLRRKSKKA